MRRRWLRWAVGLAFLALASVSLSNPGAEEEAPRCPRELLGQPCPEHRATLCLDVYGPPSPGRCLSRCTQDSECEKDEVCVPIVPGEPKAWSRCLKRSEVKDAAKRNPEAAAAEKKRRGC